MATTICFGRYDNQGPTFRARACELISESSTSQATSAAANVNDNLAEIRVASSGSDVYVNRSATASSTAFVAMVSPGSSAFVQVGIGDTISVITV